MPSSMATRGAMEEGMQAGLPQVCAQTCGKSVRTSLRKRQTGASLMCVGQDCGHSLSLLPSIVTCLYSPLSD
jgi:hypothetical protein